MGDTTRKFAYVVSNLALTDGEKVYYGIYLLLNVELELEINKQVKVFEALIETFVHGGEKQGIPVDLAGNIMPMTAGQKTTI